MPFDEPASVTTKEYGLQRFFSTFPGSWPGVGLLLLRMVVGTTAVMQGVSHLAHLDPATVVTLLPGALAIASGSALLIGFFTPGAGATAGVSSVVIALWWVPPPASGLFLDRVSALFVAADAAALVLLGPGALSLDARLFGRREIIIPHDSHQARR